MAASHRGWALHVEIEPGALTGLEAVSCAQFEQPRSVATHRLVHRLGHGGLAAGMAVRSVLSQRLET